MTDRPYPVVAADDFARRFSMRAGSLMWLLGAGASASAGIPTAWDMIWEFKQQLYVSQRRVSPKTVADLSNPAVRRSLQAFVDGLDRFPSTGAPDEHAALFEAAYPPNQLPHRLAFPQKKTIFALKNLYHPHELACSLVLAANKTRPTETVVQRRNSAARRRA